MQNKQSKLHAPTLYAIIAYSMNERECHGAALFFALMPIALRNDEFKKYYNQFSICMVNGFQQTTELEEAAYILCDNFYRRINMAEQMDEIGIFVSLPSKGSLPLFTELNLNNGFYSPTKVLSGKFIMLILKKATSITINPEKLAGKYHDGTVYTIKEIDMIPKLKDSYIVPQEVISICEHISKTAGSSHPIRNIMLRGESSVGKTSSAKAVASALGRPMVAPVTCHADFETADFLMQCSGHNPVSSRKYLRLVALSQERTH